MPELLLLIPVQLLSEASHATGEERGSIGLRVSQQDNYFM